MENATNGAKTFLELIDRIIEEATGQETPKITTFVGHMRPDDDVWLSCWIARKFIPGAENAQLVFVRAGETLPGTEDDPSVLHFDTGGGEFDQHGRNHERICSAAILAEKLGVHGDPGLLVLLEMVTAVDNIESLPPTSIHYTIVGLPRILKDGNEPDWKTIQEQIFQLFDIVYGQETNRSENRIRLERVARWQNLNNGLQIVTLLWEPGCREAAFEAGASVVIWTQRRRKNMWVGIQRNRGLTELQFNNTAAALRKAEAKVRSINLNGHDWKATGNVPPTNWFLHDSGALILCGSPTHPLRGDECTLLSPRQIEILVYESIGAIPYREVHQWTNSPLRR